MDNGALVFIIIIAAVILVWQASKLRQYHKIEQLLNRSGDANTSQATGSASASASADTQAGPSEMASSKSADAASRAVAASVGNDNEADELLDMPGVDPEANIEEAKRVQLVMARCRYAEFYLEQLDDDYERGQFQRIINSCKSTARNIEDPFFRSSALHPLVVLLNRADWSEERDELLAEVDDDLIRQRINQELATEAGS